MLILFFALLAGYAIGNFMPKGDKAFGMCVPASIVVYAVFKLLTGGDPDIMLIVALGTLQSPLLMLGVFLARSSSLRNNFDAE
ncbi:hypothetical protein ABT364_22570 [Massilia sp. SR12]